MANPFSRSFGGSASKSDPKKSFAYRSLEGYHIVSMPSGKAITLNGINGNIYQTSDKEEIEYLRNYPEAIEMTGKIKPSDIAEMQRKAMFTIK